MVTYALIEVSAKKWFTPVGDTAPIPNSLRGLGLMGVHTLIWMWYVCMAKLFSISMYMCFLSLGHLLLFYIMQELKNLFGLLDVSSSYVL